MPSPIEELALKDLVKHPKLIMLYAAFAGLGWLGDRLVPNDCQKETARWQAAFYHSERRSDSIGAVFYKESLQKDETIRQQGKTIKTIDSLLVPLGSKAKQIINNSKP